MQDSFLSKSSAYKRKGVKKWMKIYIDHAIVKVSTDDFGTNSDVILDSLLQHLTYNAGHVWACVAIKRGTKLSIGSSKHHHSMEDKNGCHLNCRHDFAFRTSQKSFNQLCYLWDIMIRCTLPLYRDISELLFDASLLLTISSWRLMCCAKEKFSMFTISVKRKFSSYLENIYYSMHSHLMLKL